MNTDDEAVPAPLSNPRARIALFAMIVALCAGAALWYGQRVVAERQGGRGGAQLDAVATLALPDRAQRPHAVFRSTELGETYGKVSYQYLDATDGRRHFGPLVCERVHFAAGSGICLDAKRGVVTTYRARLFDREFRVLHELPLAGPPSRARVSPDGRLAAMTVFVTGHSYASANFSTRTTIVDARSGTMLVENLETLPVTRDGALIRGADFNFWGVTFTRDAQRFFATLGTDGKQYLVEGDLAQRTLRVVHDNVECPSLSPDERMVAFKRRRPVGADGRLTWGVQVLELATRRETALGESRNVDDQVEWRGNGEVTYALPEDDAKGGGGTNVWVIPIAAGAQARMLLPMADSPAVAR